MQNATSCSHASASNAPTWGWWKKSQRAWDAQIQWIFPGCDSANFVLCSIRWARWVWGIWVVRKPCFVDLPWLSSMNSKKKGTSETRASVVGHCWESKQRPEPGKGLGFVPRHFWVIRSAYRVCFVFLPDVFALAFLAAWRPRLACSQLPSDQIRPVRV